MRLNGPQGPHEGPSGFVRRGKALVFTTPGDAALTNEAVQGILEETRRERDHAASLFPHDGKRQA